MQHVEGGQRKTRKHQFSASTMCFQGLNLGLKTWLQGPLPAEPSQQPKIFLVCLQCQFSGFSHCSKIKQNVSFKKLVMGTEVGLGVGYWITILFFQLFHNSKVFFKKKVKNHVPSKCSGRCAHEAGAGRI